MRTGMNKERIAFWGLVLGIVLIAVGQGLKIYGALIAEKKEDIAVEWVGSPVVSQGGVKGYVENIEYGFRGDGVMVWRVREKE